MAGRTCSSPTCATTALFHNPGAKGFWLDTTVETGVAAVSGQYVGWGDGFYDYDNDGWKDLFIVNGGLHWLIPMEDSLLRNNGDSTFTDVSSQAGDYFKFKKVGRGACFGDYDNDGLMDVFVVTLGGKGILLHAKPPASRTAQSLAHDQAGGNQEQSRWIWRQPGSCRRRPHQYVAGSLRKRISFARRPAPALRLGAARSRR